MTGLTKARHVCFVVISFETLLFFLSNNILPSDPWYKNTELSREQNIIFRICCQVVQLWGQAIFLDQLKINTVYITIVNSKLLILT